MFVEQTRTMQFQDERKLDRVTIQNKAQGATMGHYLKIRRQLGSYNVTVHLDLEKVFASMGRKAALSRSGKCVDGFLTVKAKIRPESPPPDIIDNPIPEGWVQISEAP